jgi:hypothetical protein
VPRPRVLLIAAAGLVVFVAISFVLARYLTTETRERNAIYDLLTDQARGDAAGVVQRLDGCAGDPACAATARANARRLKQAGKIRIIRLDSGTAYALGSATGTTRVVWAVVPAGRTVVQCVVVHRGGSVLSGRSVMLRRLSAPIGLQAAC